ncbi:MAG: hypothetical protein CMN78_06460 [Spirochaetales bacterium]|nr:hypothetical protein [Spirochaetales bacterium]
MAILIALLGVAIVVVAVVFIRPSIGQAKGGRIVLLLALFVLPVLVFVFGATTHLENSKQTNFCLSCHAMKPYGETLKIDDQAFIPAVHSQNHLIPSDKACYTCHTTYTMFGGVKVKLQGLRHFFIQYLGKPPEQIELYEPFNNRECLHCHGEARSFLEDPIHEATLVDLESNELSCTECHYLFHEVAELASQKLWDRGEEE